jgi:hypothetical protein
MKLFEKTTPHIYHAIFFAEVMHEDYITDCDTEKLTIQWTMDNSQYASQHIS